MTKLNALRSGQFGLCSFQADFEPLPRVLLPGEFDKVEAEGVMIDQRPLDAIKVEDHPEIELRKEQGRSVPHLVIRGLGVATHMVRERVDRVRKQPQR